MQNRTFWDWKHKIHFLEKGQGSQHILLLHGYGSHTATWSDLIDPLVQAGYKVWALDLLGFGYSDKPLEVNYGLELYLEQVLAFMEKMQILKADLISHSMGSSVALGLALHTPEKFTSLTLISPMAYPFKLPLGFRFAKRFPFLVKPFCGLSFIRSFRKQLVINKEVACTPQKVSEAAEPFFLPNGANSAFHILGKFDNQLLVNLSQKYNQIKHPSLIIWGEQDPLIPSKHALQFKADIPHAKIVLFKDCGHIPHEEYPKKAEELILQFLEVDDASI